MPTDDEEKMLERLRGVSTAAARVVRRRPNLLRFCLKPPGFQALARINESNEPHARLLLRQLRSRLLVYSAYAERSGESPLHTAALWSDYGDAALQLADRVAFFQVSQRFGVPIDDDGQAIGRAIFGLGKLGARELNPSSDIDLLLAYSSDQGRAGELTAHEFFTRWANAVRDLLADVDDEGFAFRVDFDLRPEGTRGPVVNSVDALESYYERFGQIWEKAALVRLRPIVSTMNVGDVVMRRLRPFIFPRSPDPRLIESLADMRARIAATAPDSGFDVKRTEGGIRDVEFRVQALQLLHGGRMPELRTGSTVELLGRLRAHGLLDHRTAVELEDGYVFLRRVEHALQYREDQQTQHLPEEGEERERIRPLIARALGLDPKHGFEALLKKTREEVRAAYDQLFHDLGRSASPQALLALDRTASDDQRLDALHKVGFSDARTALGLLRQLARFKGSPFSPATQAREFRARRIAARLLDQTGRSPQPMHALGRLPDLLRSLSGTGRVLGLLEDDRLRGLLVRVLASSPSLSRLLTRGSVDTRVLGLGPRPLRTSRVAVLSAMTEEADDRAEDEEQALVRMRRVKASETLRIGLGFLDGRLGVIECGHRLTSVADAAVERALQIALIRLNRRFGELEGAEVSVLAQGRQGGREMGFLSDLDLLFVWDGEGETAGKASIDAREWAGRFAQQTLWALTAPLGQGACYDVDTRLRPSGSKGPLCVRYDQLVRYHEQEAALWERQALLKLRPVAGSRSLGARVIVAAQEAVTRLPPPLLGTALLDMRQRMIRERARPAAGFDLKLSEGGSADVEFAVQGLQLRWAKERGLLWMPSTRRALRRLQEREWIGGDEAATLRDAFETLSLVREALLLASDGQDAVINRADPRLELLARMGGLEIPASSGPALYDLCLDAAARVRETSSRILITL